MRKIPSSFSSATTAARREVRPQATAHCAVSRRKPGEGGIRVPWIIQWKRRIPAGKLDDRPVIQLDILPAALAAAGVEAKPDWNLDGVNLLPYLTGGKAGTPHDSLYWRFGQQIALRMGDWKLVKAPGGGTKPGELAGKATTEGAQLYNLKEDIGETQNLAEKNLQKLKELAGVWEKWNAQMIEPKWGPPRSPAAAAKKGQRARPDSPEKRTK